MVDEQDSPALAGVIRRLVADQAARHAMASAAKSLSRPHAADEIASRIERLAMGATEGSGESQSGPSTAD